MCPGTCVRKGWLTSLIVEPSNPGVSGRINAILGGSLTLTRATKHTLSDRQSDQESGKEVLMILVDTKGGICHGVCDLRSNQVPEDEFFGLKHLGTVAFQPVGDSSNTLGCS